MSAEYDGLSGERGLFLSSDILRGGGRGDILVLRVSGGGERLDLRAGGSGERERWAATGDSLDLELLAVSILLER